MRRSAPLLNLFLRQARVPKGPWMAILALSVGDALLGLINPYLVRPIVDQGVLKSDLKTFLAIAGAGVAVFLVKEGVKAVKEVLERDLRVRARFDLSRRLFDRVQGETWLAGHGRTTGGLFYSFHGDVEHVTDGLTLVLPQAVFLIPRVLVTFVLVFLLSPAMATASLILLPLILLPSFFMGRWPQRLVARTIEVSEASAKILQELLTRRDLIKAFGREGWARRRYVGALANAARLEGEMNRAEILSASAVEILGKLGIGCLTFWGGALVIRGHLSPGTLAAVLAYLAQFAGLAGQVESVYRSGLESVVSARRLEPFFEKPAESDGSPGAGRVISSGKIEFRGVTFGYPGSPRLLRRASFMVDPGCVTALVGPSGCGKTTAVLLLLGLLTPEEGAILIDGREVERSSFVSLRQQAGIVLQDPFLLDDTVEANIRFGDPKASSGDARRAAQLAGVEEFAGSWPEGLATRLGENACRVSEGQKQKIAIARALIRRPRFLILDEAMSRMDAASEERILREVRAAYPQMTLLIVSHRIRTFRAADRAIYWADPGRMISGLPEDLWEREAGLRLLFAEPERGAV